MTTTHPQQGMWAFWRWLRRRTELGFALGVLGVAVFVTVGTVTMEVPDGVGSPGPRFFPTLVAGFLYATGVLLAVDVIRHPKNRGSGTGSSQFSTDMLQDFGAIGDADEIRAVATGARRPGSGSPATGPDDPGEMPPGDPGESTIAAEAPGTEYVPVDYRTVGIVLGALVLFILLLAPVGWLLMSAALFWTICYALGSTRPVFDIAVSIVAASVIQLAFSAALGLNLPAGILEGVLPWSN